MRACRREPVPYTPVWLMRQAGRYMREYREVREKTTFLELCKNPGLAAEVTVTAVERLGVDAAIIFADILLILEPLGLRLEFSKGDGPVIHNPVRSGVDVERLRELEDPAALDFVFEAIKHTRQALPGNLPLIGFSGAPFTLASYAIEGGHSNTFAKTKALMYGHPEAWHRLCEKLSSVVSNYLVAQIEAGVDAVQVFDSWVGVLSAADYREFALPHTRPLFDAVKKRVPTIHFGTGTAAILEELREAGGDVIGVDWRIPIDEAWTRIGADRGVQGNLDPTLLLGPPARMLQQTDSVLARIGNRPGHIFNLGHGILPSTPVEHVQMLAQYVHSASRRH